MGLNVDIATGLRSLSSPARQRKKTSSQPRRHLSSSSIRREPLTSEGPVTQTRQTDVEIHVRRREFDTIFEHEVNCYYSRSKLFAVIL